MTMHDGDVATFFGANGASVDFTFWEDAERDEEGYVTRSCGATCGECGEGVNASDDACRDHLDECMGDPDVEDGDDETVDAQREAARLTIAAREAARLAARAARHAAMLAR